PRAGLGPEHAGFGRARPRVHRVVDEVPRDLDQAARADAGIAVIDAVEAAFDLVALDDRPPDRRAQKKDAPPAREAHEVVLDVDDVSARNQDQVVLGLRGARGRRVTRRARADDVADDLDVRSAQDIDVAAAGADPGEISSAVKAQAPDRHGV